MESFIYMAIGLLVFAYIIVFMTWKTRNQTWTNVFLVAVGLYFAFIFIGLLINYPFGAGVIAFFGFLIWELHKQSHPKR